jgi:hypothetical protein
MWSGGCFPAGREGRSCWQLGRRLFSLPLEPYVVAVVVGSTWRTRVNLRDVDGVRISQTPGVGAADACSLPRERFLWHREGFGKSGRCREARAVW